jgi:acetylornithine deacetylase/succinyl-diaminopimelate desuccinylase-like protein
MLKASYKSNVIPPSAEATLDVRALPDEDLGKFRETLAVFINDPLVKVVAENVSFSMPAPPPSKLSTEMFAALERAQNEVSREAITLPTMTTGATDSSFLRAGLASSVHPFLVSWSRLSKSYFFTIKRPTPAGGLNATGFLVIAFIMSGPLPGTPF